jgi:iron complex transport system substrate-binding protein
MTLPFLFITACHSSVLQRSDNPSANSTQCRIVQHKLGKICIPIAPRRIIALNPRHLVDPLLALGIQPIGMTITVNQGKEETEGLTLDNTQSIAKVGDSQQPSLEKILQLKPDLILAMDYG